MGDTALYYHPVRLDVASDRAALNRALGDVSGRRFQWGSISEAAFAALRNEQRNHHPGIWLRELPPADPDIYFVRPLMVHGPNVCFGDCAAGKSLLATALATAGSLGLEFCNLTIPKRPVLYIDYEASANDLIRRSTRITAGLKTQATAEILYWKETQPLSTCASTIRRVCDENEIGWVIVDSAGLACGGAPEESRAALEFFRAVEEIGRPAWILAHITKSDTARQSPFGSAFWKNGARRVWYQQAESDGEELSIGLFLRKFNDGVRSKDPAFRANFAGEEGPISFARADVSENADLLASTRPEFRLAHALASGPKTVKQLVEECEIEDGTVRRTLIGKAKTFVKLGKADSSGGKCADLWGLLEGTR